MGHMGYLQSLAIMNSAAVNMVCKWLCHILKHIPSDICPVVVSLDCMVILFLVFWRTSIMLSIVVVLIYIPTSSVEVFLFPHSHQHLLLLAQLVSHFGWVRWNLNVVLICISFLAKDVEYFVMYLLATWISSSENYLLSSFAHLFSGMLILWEVSFLNSL
jgi:hypothetical protein